MDDKNLLNAIISFIFTVDEVTTVGKICKNYNTIARNNMLSIKINGPSLENVT